MNLLRISYMLDQSAARERGKQTAQAFAQQLDRAPSSMPQMLVALAWSRVKPKQVVIAGKVGAPDTSAMLREVHRHFIPHKILILADGGTGQKFFARHVEFIKNVTEIDDKATAYVCENFVCQLPSTDVTVVADLLARKKTAQAVGK